MGKLNDLTGQSFHYWTVVNREGSTPAKKATWNCVCKCGTERIVVGSDLKNGASKSCSCHQKEVVSAIQVHGMRATKTYSVWSAMKARCQNPAVNNCDNYGGRGISVCSEWQDFVNFYDDMGECPEDYSIDRINNNGNYEASNCKWSSKKEQCNNKRNNRMLNFEGKTQTLKQWSEESGIAYDTLRKRINHGWNMAKALATQPIIGRNQYVNT